jgi:hypothetical protein
MSYEGWELDFERLTPHITAALAYTGTPPTHRLEDVRRGLADGHYQLWPSHRSVLITSLHRYPSGVVVCNVFLAGGHLEEIRVLLPILESWAKSQGCARMTCTGRIGWARTFVTSEEGWIPALTFYSKELSHV